MIVAASERHSSAPKRGCCCVVESSSCTAAAATPASELRHICQIGNPSSSSTQWVDAHCPQARFAACATRPHNRLTNSPPSQYPLVSPSHPAAESAPMPFHLAFLFETNISQTTPNSYCNTRKGEPDRSSHLHTCNADSRVPPSTATFKRWLAASRSLLEIKARSTPIHHLPTPYSRSQFKSTFWQVMSELK